MIRESAMDFMGGGQGGLGPAPVGSLLCECRVIFSIFFVC